MHSTVGRRGARGATVVEYALGLSFVLVATVGALSAFEDRSADALEERGSSIGTPDLDAAGPTTSTSTTLASGTGGTTTTSAPPTPPSTTVASATGTSHSSGNKWAATVVISVTDGSTPVHRAQVDGIWNPSAGSPESVTCSTQPNGTCTFTLRNLPTNGNSGHVASVQFTVTAVTPNGGTTSTPSVSVTVFEP